MDDQRSGERQDDTSERRPSWSPLPITVLYIIIAVITPYIGMSFGVLLFAVLSGLFIRDALSPKEYEKVRKSYPGYSRADYIINNLLLQTVLPLFLVALLALLIGSLKL